VPVGCRSGQVQLDITWEASARSVLTTKLRALERVLAQRQEILAALRPVPAAVVRGWEVPEQGTLQVRGRAAGWTAWQKGMLTMRNGKTAGAHELPTVCQASMLGSLRCTCNLSRHINLRPTTGRGRGAHAARRHDGCGRQPVWR